MLGPSAADDRLRCAGQGRADAETVITDAIKMTPNNVERTEWRWLFVIWKCLVVRAIRTCWDKEPTNH